MDEQVDRLVTKAWDKLRETPSNERLLIAVGGIPGSGKTTLSQLIVSRINAFAQISSPAEPSPAAFVPMDGYHLTRAQLSALPDPVEAHARRGAAFTFDAPAYLDLVRRLREPLAPESPTIRAPSFDHAVKDPKYDDIAIEAHHRLLVFEGNYVALDKPLWRDAARLMDELWFVEVDFDVARRRLIKRHVAAGIASDEADADKRARENDLVNGQEIVDFRLNVDEVIVSREDEGWAPRG
ncbi:P-loop containing nucleoside triphosphate hydrolase protein [Sodiomyces alkalinus F11]|uniref:P-loop containing nucleoside triphosphate hydrolase protein n=1 Tax=Sodiomyces alkalinus (strain CBS 110278 / VKM F-3762 / F11) TaxID=1314773 RepID=A0A3N2PLT2_SODAK|nr:P-loop containing nucleoside triphosphate hydrolase protein [Sodiomyces alkalinus F11]ROT35495.1 P-loop containing nucleoside triphosphate hydrolase protein [Sodiomyces alkalinus F11]